MEKKEHLNLDGLNKIRQIKSGMNTGRIINKEDKFSEQPAMPATATSISR
jgi:hypothetical protein